MEIIEKKVNLNNGQVIEEKIEISEVEMKSRIEKENRIMELRHLIERAKLTMDRVFYEGNYGIFADDIADQIMYYEKELKTIN